MDDCTDCSKCCQKHWLVRLDNKYQKEFFKEQLVFGEFIFTDTCQHLKNNKCDIHENDLRPSKCREYFCEGNPPETNTK